tara:strand:+ start:165 stop:347 length:183 start_codon:yes stop_codon:yes gene_type:complete
MSQKKKPNPKKSVKSDTFGNRSSKPDNAPMKKSATEIGGREGPDPTRFGDWEKDGRCVDF